MFAVPLASAPLSSEFDPAQAAVSRGRPSWSGLVQLGLLAIPVRAFPATVAAPDLPCHQLHAGCGRRIRYAKHCPEHGPLEAGAIVKGYEHHPGQFLVLDETEMEPLRPAQDRALALDAFLDLDRLDPALFAGRTLYLAPEGPAARPAYRVLADALRRRGKAGLGRLVLSGRRQLALIRPAGVLLALHVLHYPAQLRGPAALAADVPPGPVGPAEARLADALVDAYSRPVRWADYRDDSAERLAALVEARLAGGTAGSRAVPEEVPILSLLDALRRSVAALTTPIPVPASAAASAAANVEVSAAAPKRRARRRSA